MLDDEADSTALYEAITDPTPARIPSAKGQRYNSCIVRSSGGRSIRRAPSQPLTPSSTGSEPTDVGAVCRLQDVVHAVHLLFVPDKVLDGGDDALGLHPFDGLGGRHCLVVGFRAEAFPIPATARLPAQGPDGRSQVEIRPFPAELLAESDTAGKHQIFVPRRSRRDTGGEGRDVICGADPESTILVSLLRKANPVIAPRFPHSRPTLVFCLHGLFSFFFFFFW